MCGIAGTYARPGRPPASFDTLTRMVAMLGHRGPDGHGLYRDERVGLAHARLSIIDLEGGFQPLTNEDRTVWLTFNGEIFNYLELRRDLQAAGHRFTTDGDSEVIVHLYEQHGERAWAMLNGQFAFALWDRRKEQLWLVRDRVGILPLHYAVADGNLHFASEAKALFGGGSVQPDIDPTGLAETFTRWSTAAPRTVFRGVRTVRPGAAVCFDTELREREHRYWELEIGADDASARLSTEAAADELGARLRDAITLRLRADVPVGAYLSGGLDSSVIASLVRSVDTSPLETFAVRFADPAFDETDEQRRMADVLGTDHHEVLCGDREIRDAISDVVWHCESPLLRTAPAPLFVLSGLVRQQGMKVVLTGEGADELLGGYGIFKEDKVRRFWARDPQSAMRPRLLARVHSEVATDEGGGARGEMWQRFFGRHLTETDDPLYSHLIRWENTGWSRRVLDPAVRNASTPESIASSLREELPRDWSAWTPMARAQWLEIQTFMTPYLLASQGDRVAMAHGIEVRYPFLDPEVIRLCSRLPDRLKMAGLHDKVALRRLASRTLPPEIWRRPKQPYRAPMTAPFFASPDEEVDDLLSLASCERYGMVDGKAAATLLAKARRRRGAMGGEREEMALVGMLTLQMLGRAFLDDFDAIARERRTRFETSHRYVYEDEVGARERTPAVPGVDAR